MKTTWARIGGWVFAALASAAGVARGQILEPQVLVVYDSRLADSKAVAEYYAGSNRIAGATGTFKGTRPGVRVMDLSAWGAGPVAPGDISYAGFISNIRTPIRGYLTQNKLAQTIRVIVLTKGLPHRVQDLNSAAVGDNPAQSGNAWNASNYTAASVDSELTLLWQNLSAGEANGGADSRADGLVVNPFYKSTTALVTRSTANITTAKSFVLTLSPGPYWRAATNADVTQNLTPGDMYLVCRLDGNTVADVRAMIDRGKDPYVNMSGVALLLDESNANGTADTSQNGEFDNQGDPWVRTNDDYEATRDFLLNSDRRFASAGVQYDQFGGGNNFFVGPNLPSGVSWNPTVRLVTNPVLLIASYGANHSGLPTRSDGQPAGTTYARTFTYAPGAMFNTIESYNGRAFGGLGQNQFAAQQQAADFIAAGGTFAVANVWEPFAISVPKNFWIVRNFYLGTMTWAEAAYSGIPCLSWHQIVLGDPLARVQRSTDDVNGDGAVDIDDLYTWERLFVDAPTDPRLDVNRDNARNNADRVSLTNTLRAGENYILRYRE
jgi:hypothetical protein